MSQNEIDFESVSTNDQNHRSKDNAKNIIDERCNFEYDHGGKMQAVNSITKTYSNEDEIKNLVNSLTIDTECFINDLKRYNISTMKDKEDFYVCGRIYIKSLNERDKLDKLKLDIGLHHKCLPTLNGFDSSENGSEILEIRKIDFEPHPLTKPFLSEATQSQIMKIISQIIDFFNYVSVNKHSVTLLTLDDLFSCCFLDSDFNLYFGDLSFIEVDYHSNKTIFSLGMIVYQLLGHEMEITEDGTIEKPAFEEISELFWRKFISSCWIENIQVCSFYSPFMQHKEDNVDNLLIENELESIEFQMKEKQKKILKDKKIIFDSCFSAKEALNKYQNKIYHHLNARKDERFEKIRAEIGEDGKTVFIERINEKLEDQFVSKFLIEMELVHPMIPPLKGFFCADTKLNTVLIYRETDQHFNPIDHERIINSPYQTKFKWLKQIICFVSFIIEETTLKINKPSLDDCAALDQNDDIFFVYLYFLDQCYDEEEREFFNLLSFWKFAKKIVSGIKLPSTINKIFLKEKEDRDYDDFLLLKDFVEDYDPDNDPSEKHVIEYLKDYEVENEIIGHQCHVEIYKRNLLSEKKFKRLVLKQYDFTFSENLKTLLENLKNEEKDIIETWTKDNKSFILMKFIKARRLRDLIPNLDYDKKILVLKKHCLFHQKAF